MNENLNQFLEDDIIKELREDFLEDLKFRIGVIGKNTVEMEKNGINKELVKETYRILHNTKGTAGTLGLNEIYTLTHRIEDIFSYMLQEEKILPDTFSKIFKMTDILDNLREGYLKGLSPKELEQILTGVLTSPKKQLQVILVENSKSMIKYIASQLNAKGHNVVDGKSPLFALTRILTEPFDVLITSKEHAVLDGVNLIRMVKANEKKKHIKCVLITSDQLQLKEADFIIQKDKNFKEKVQQWLDGII